MAEIDPLPTPRPTEALGASLREQLETRRRRLARLGAVRGHAEIHGLLREVDAALLRLEDGSYGVCEECEVALDADRLAQDPAARVCLECLGAGERRALERDLELAARVQAALLPAPRIDEAGWEMAYRYEAAGPVSGDYVDVLPAPRRGGPLHFLLGDVSGKGVAASIVMAHLHAVFRSLVPLGAPLRDLVSQANRLLVQSTVPSSYATLVAGRLHADGALELCNAGHASPLLARNGEIAALPATGLPLGLFASADFEARVFQLRAGDLLLLPTDGLTEAHDPAGRQYGAARLGESLRGARGTSLEAVLDRCLVDLSAFRGGTPTPDDLSLMAVRRTA